MEFDTASKIIAAAIDGATVKSMQQLTGGVSAEVYRIDVQLPRGDKKSVVLRIHGDRHSGHPAQLEYDLLRWLNNAGLPVPGIIALDPSCRLVSDPYLLLEFIPGSSDIYSGETNIYIRKMADMLAHIHSTPTTSIVQLPERVEPLPELLDYLPQGPQWIAVRDYFRSLKKSSFIEQPVLLHGDFWPENLLWLNGRISGVLDWEDAAIGDPLSDVACARLEIRYKFGVAGMDTFTRAYQHHYPIDSQRLALWQVYVASAAQQFMSAWGLEPNLETHMRNTALLCIQEAFNELAPATDVRPF